MLHVDIPTPADLKTLIAVRDGICASIYLKTTPAGAGISGDRIAFKDAVKRAIAEIDGSGADKRRVTALAEHFDDLLDDDEFWRYQARSLAILATPDNLRTFRLPNHLEPIVEISDRFFLKPLMRAITFPNACYILALAEGSARLVDVAPGVASATVNVHGLPRSAAASVGKSTINDRTPSGRIQGSEGQKVRLRQYARAVDSALRPLLSGSNVPLILAATEPLESIFRSVNTYAHLAPRQIEGSPGALSDDQLAERARAILDGLYRDELSAWSARFDSHAQHGRTTTDIAQAARAATAGAVESMLVNIEHVTHGTVGDDGSVTFAEQPGPHSYGVVDEIADRVILAGGSVLAVRTADIPGGMPLAAILRYPA
jgi:hypothetical protein